MNIYGYLYYVDATLAISYVTHMSKREIIHIPDPILRRTSTPIEQVDENVLKLLDDMAETMYDAPGIGLAAIQVAEPVRLVVVDCEKRSEADEENSGEPDREAVASEDERNPIFLINPEIVSFGDNPSVYEEGCLSIPEFYAEVERPESCVVQYIDRAGNKQELHADGLLSTCLQHEIDHLNGKLFIDYLSKLKRDRVVKKFTKIAKHSGKPMIG